VMMTMTRPRRFENWRAECDQAIVLKQLWHTVVTADAPAICTPDIIVPAAIYVTTDYKALINSTLGCHSRFCNQTLQIEGYRIC